MPKITLHCFCGSDFLWLAALCAHVSVQPECLDFWGGSIANLKKKIRSIRNATSYDKKKETLRTNRILRQEEKNSESALKEFEKSGRW